MASLQSVINERFLNRVLALQQGEQRQGQAVAKALSGRSEEDKVTTSIRAGSKMYARALTGINFGISFLNFARSDLQQVADLTDEMIRVLEEAASPAGSKNDRLKAQRVIQEIGSDIKDILKGAEVGDRKYLTGEGIREVFAAIGLDPGENREIGEVFDKFVALENAEEELVDFDIKGTNTGIPRELGRPKPAQDSQPLFDGSRALTKTADAYAMLDDLKAFSNQVKSNIQVVDELAGVLGENALLVRTTAIAFLEIEDSISSEPEASDVARRLQQMILRNARAALSHAENLEPMIVATLNYNKSGIVVDQE